MIDATTALAFSVFENKGVFAILLGSGISRAAEIPTGWEITLNLTQRVATLEGVGEQADWAAWHLQRFGAPPNYSALLDGLAQTPDERRAIIHRFIEPTPDDLAEGRKVSTAGHRAIARLVRDGFIRVIITTNFDRLMENALRDEGVEPVVVKSDDDLQGATPLTHTRCFVLKLHGDYLDTRLRNTEGELAAYSELQDRCLDRILDEHGLIVCGWSAEWDDALRSAILRAASRRYPLFWASRGEPGRFARDIIAQRAGRLIQIENADSFFGKLQRDVETQSALMRPNPLSVELLVATAKRYLAKAEHRIQLSDLVSDEARRARRLVAEGEFSPHTRIDAAEFRRRVEAYEAIHEGLIRVLFAMGRWGAGEEFGLAAELLKSLAHRPERNGVVVWLGLQSYPGVLALYAYGLGLLKADRLGDLRRWFAIPLREPHREEPRTAVEKLFLWAWDGHDEATWRTFSGLDRHKTPLSEYLLGRFREWFREEFPSQIDLDITYEIFETLAGLAHLGLTTTLDALRSTLAQPDARNHAWSPVGRLGWNEIDRAEVLAAVFGEDRKATILRAGFARGEADFLALAEENLKRAFQRFRWL
jgi:hypothetical protein